MKQLLLGGTLHALGVTRTNDLELEQCVSKFVLLKQVFSIDLIVSNPSETKASSIYRD
jgi:hypothetical protein